MSDTLNNFAPALSATSDLPSVPPETGEGAPGPSDAIPSEPAQTPEAPALSESVEPAQEPTPEPEAPKEPKGVGKALAEKDARIAAAERARRDAEVKAEAMQRALEQLSARIPEPPKAAEPEPPADTRPSREQYNSPDEYDTALVEWAGRVSAREARAQLEKDAKARVEAEEQAKAKTEAEKQTSDLMVKWTERKTKFMEDNYDYSEVAERSDLSISQHMANLIVQAENGPAIAYHLGKNPELASRIASLSAPMQIFEMGRIAAEIARPKPSVSKAPEPARPVRSSAATAVQLSDNELPMDEYAAKRQAKLLEQQRRPGQPAIH